MPRFKEAPGRRGQFVSRPQPSTARLNIAEPATSPPIPPASSPSEVPPGASSAETTEGKSPLGLAMVVFGVPLAAIVLMAIIKRLLM
jgi:hypothetical protein